MMLSSSTIQVLGLLPFLLLSLAISSLAIFPAQKSLQYGYYQLTCPLAEIVIRDTVNRAVSRNPRIAAGLIRLHFHDCFVRGCDASVLLDDGPGGALSEKQVTPNKNSLKGFKVIDEAKATLEKLCPGTVSCADIIAIAARDSAYRAGRIWWDVPAGRRDGRISLANETLQHLPSAFADIKGLQRSFRAKGTAHCPSFQRRLYPDPDPSMDPGYVDFLRTICPPPPSSNATGEAPSAAYLDPFTPNRLDNKYYVDLKMRRGLFNSDQALMNNPFTAKRVMMYAKYNSLWTRNFAAAMVHLGYLHVLTGEQGEIRKNCHVINS